MRRCLINYASGSWYPKGQKRLKESLIGKFKGDILLYNQKNLPDCPTHKQIPYGFKPYIMDKVRQLEYDSALWVDASFWAIKNIDSLFNLIEREGCILQITDQWMGHWSSDRSLRGFGLTREEAFKILMPAGGLVGFGFRNEVGNIFLDEWKKLSEDGVTFHGDWWNKNHSVSTNDSVQGHRHDMVALSALVKKFNIKVQGYQTLFTYPSLYNRGKYKGAYFLARGM